MHFALEFASLCLILITFASKGESLRIDFSVRELKYYVLRYHVLL